MPYVYLWHALVLHAYATRMYFYVIRMSLVCTHMSSVCHSYVLLCHPYVTRMYSYVIRISLVCTRMSSVWHSYVLVCHPYVTRMYAYVIRMSLACGFTINLFYYYGLIQKVWIFSSWCIPSGATRRFFLKKRCMLIKNIVRHTWGRLPLLAVFVSFRESLNLRLELIYMMYDKLTRGRLVSWT